MLKRTLSRCYGLAQKGRHVSSANGFLGNGAYDRRLGDSLLISKAFLSSEIAAVYETIRCEVDSPVGMVAIARPKALNAVSMKVCHPCDSCKKELLLFGLVTDTSQSTV